MNRKKPERNKARNKARNQEKTDQENGFPAILSTILVKHKKTPWKEPPYAFRQALFQGVFL